MAACVTVVERGSPPDAKRMAEIGRPLEKLSTNSAAQVERRKRVHFRHF